MRTRNLASAGAEGRKADDPAVCTSCFPSLDCRSSYYSITLEVQSCRIGMIFKSNRCQTQRVSAGYVPVSLTTAAGTYHIVLLFPLSCSEHVVKKPFGPAKQNYNCFPFPFQSVTLFALAGSWDAQASHPSFFGFKLLVQSRNWPHFVPKQRLEVWNLHRHQRGIGSNILTTTENYLLIE